MTFVFSVHEDADLRISGANSGLYSVSRRFDAEWRGLTLRPSDIRTVLDGFNADPSPRDLFATERRFGMLGEQYATIRAAVEPDGTIAFHIATSYFGGPPEPRSLALPYEEWVRILGIIVPNWADYMDKIGIQPLSGKVYDDRGVTTEGL